MFGQTQSDCFRLNLGQSYFLLNKVPVLDAVEALGDGHEGGLSAPAGLGLLGVSPVVRGHHEEVAGGEGADELLGRGGILAERGRRDEGGGVRPACLQGSHFGF